MEWAKGWHFFCAWNLSKYTLPFSFWEISRPALPSNVVPLLCSIRKKFICYGFRTCANMFNSKFQAWARLEAVCGPAMLTVGQRNLGFTFVHHSIAAWEEAGLGWIPQRWVTFMFYIICIFKNCPWAWTSATFHEKNLWLSRGKPYWILSAY